jgi:hypothetical protein
MGVKGQTGGDNAGSQSENLPRSEAPTLSFIPSAPFHISNIHLSPWKPDKHFINTTNPKIKLGNLPCSIPPDLAFSLGRKTSKKMDEKVDVLLYGVGA